MANRITVTVTPRAAQYLAALHGYAPQGSIAKEALERGLASLAQDHFAGMARRQHALGKVIAAQGPQARPAHQSPPIELPDTTPPPSKHVAATAPVAVEDDLDGLIRDEEPPSDPEPESVPEPDILEEFGNLLEEEAL